MQDTLNVCRSPSTNPESVLSLPKISSGRSVLKRSLRDSSRGGLKVARCLFGPPDPKQSQDMVRQIEENNSITFRKRFNFDIVSGEPLPETKKVKLSETPSFKDTSEKDTAAEDADGKQQDDNESDKTYKWSEVYNLDDLDSCNVFFRMVGQLKHRHPTLSSSTRRSLFVGTL